MKFSDLLKELKSDYLNILPERIANIEKLLMEKNWQQLHVEFHKLKGTGKTYGFPEVSEICEKMEKATLHPADYHLVPGGLAELKKILEKRQKE